MSIPSGMARKEKSIQRLERGKKGGRGSLLELPADDAELLDDERSLDVELPLLLELPPELLELPPELLELPPELLELRLGDPPLDPLDRLPPDDPLLVPLPLPE